MTNFSRFLLCAILITTAHTFRGFLWQADTLSPVLRELSSVVIFLADFPLMALLVVSVVRLLRDERFNHTIAIIMKRFGGAFWIGLIGWVMVGAVWAEETTLVQYTVFRLVLELNLALVTADLVRRGMGRSLALALLLGAGIQSCLAVAQVIHGGALGLGWLGELQADEIYNTGSRLRGYGLTVNPNNLSGYLLIALFGWVWLLSLQERQAPLLLLGMLLFSGLLATGSSTAILSLLLVSGLLFFRQRPHVLLVVIAAGGLLWWRESSVPMRDRLFFAYDDTLEVIQESPILGVGGDQLMVEIARQRPFSEALLLPAHNAFLMIWAELGLPGLILILLIFGQVMGTTLSTYTPNLIAKHRPDPIFIWGGCMLAIGLVMLFDFYFWGDFRLRILWLWVMGMWWGEITHRLDEDSKVR